MTLVAVTEERGITTLALNSPATRNALSAALVTELSDALTACGKDPAVRAVVLGHTGGTFSAGADLKAPPSPYAFVDLLRQVVELPKPVVGHVTGHVRAGGLGLLGACDIVLAGETADFALTEVRIGVAPAVISLTLLPKLEPRAAARHYLTGERFGVPEAVAMGLVTDGDQALPGILDALRAASPQGLREAKRLVTARVLETFERDAEDLVQRSATLFASPEAREGMTAFLERRDPAWRL
ncbi:MULTISPECIES: enoyl-CoA hydratase family protein [Streptomyces]|uniref:Methylglutaconyl-CoA hydratase n=1 Tax=Streptomyces venezuelae (strain ATCC 10712 / CBS 650.69 / DSM 40230 / JCM 4526 / NBRC 13096 / PD 04745) TaxID=953739 RepID=F2RID0_STRVP|nr:enoyl-CoA hydratase family protein [Streptomyces venezuelae]APE23193.1 enoyl-CoA hydratase [Streptomyces venezuelae]QES00572.1 enoyl-CoA hydratase family protein [Streptomyces venezuelae ATCC 10712]QES07658.1 enoyl-CoA hydratase family protein [Streptomyces venezuelae]QES13667.1 enoyl-CoA hydratase family protein [Streptomyces venezuelae]CCA57486.1 Methylglutaconyl-CoA hydratase [Streptomyces venezuelae ATCC 10712]